MNVQEEQQANYQDYVQPQQQNQAQPQQNVELAETDRKWVEKNKWFGGGSGRSWSSVVK